MPGHPLTMLRYVGDGLTHGRNGGVMIGNQPFMRSVASRILKASGLGRVKSSAEPVQASKRSPSMSHRDPARQVGAGRH
jgi:hypothetical protein